MWGGDFTSFWAANEATKNKINKSVRDLWEPLDDDFTQQPIKNTIGTSEGVSYRTRDLTGT